MNIIKFTNKYNKVILFLVGWILFISVELQCKNITWSCYAADYWGRGVKLVNNHFDFSAFNGFRGYVFPLFLALLIKLEDKKHGF